MTVVSEPGDPVGLGIDRAFDAAGTVSLRGSAALATVEVGSHGGTLSLEMAPPAGRHLEDGEYPAAAHYPSEPADQPGLSVSEEGRSCRVAYGRFTIKDIQVSQSGKVTRLWADYEQRCEHSSAPALFGEVRIGEPVVKTPESAFPVAVDWPNLTADTDSAAVPVTVVGTKTGSDVASVGLAGEGAAEFSLAADHCAGVTLGGGSQCEVAVQARPRRPGAHRAQLVITDRSGARTTVPLAIEAEPVLAIQSATLVSESGDYIGQGTDRVLDAPRDLAVLSNGNYVEVRAEAEGESFTFEFAAPRGQTLAQGSYLDAERYPFQEAGLPGISVGASNRGCNTDYGHFVVKDIAFNGAGQVTRLWVLYEQRCETRTAPALFGEIRIGEPPAEDPEAAIPTAVEWPATVTGTKEAAVPVSVVGGETGGLITSVAIEGEDASEFGLATDECEGAILLPAEQCQVSVTARPQALGLRTADLAITDASGAKEIVPLAAYGEPPPQPEANFATAVSVASEVAPASSALFAAPATFRLRTEDGSVDASVSYPGHEGAAGASLDVSLRAPHGEPLAVGEYTGAERLPPEGSGRPGLDVGVDSSGCNRGYGRFTVKEIAYSKAGVATKLWATYERYCEYDSNSVFGEVRIGFSPAGTPETAVPAGVEWPSVRAHADGGSVPVTLFGGASGGRVASVAIEGPDAGDFTLDGDHCLGATLAPSETCEMQVGVTPTAAGLRQADLVVTDATGSTTTVPLVITAEPALQIDSVTMTSEPGDYIGDGQEVSFQGPRTLAIVGENEGERVSARTAFAPSNFSFEFGAPGGKHLGVGEYAGAEGTPEAGHPVLSVSGDGRACNRDYGRFIIEDLGYNSAGRLTRLWALFEQHCETPTAPALYGEVRIGEPAGAAPEAAIPAGVEWPATKPGAVGATVPVTVTAGELGDEITGVSLAGEGAAEFNIAGDNCVGLIMTWPRSCVVQVTARPTVSGPRSAQLVITNASGTQVTVPLAVYASG